jgi:nucleoside-diphosphate-sugar epimerase
MANILVTGVDGFTGRYLAPVLCAAGHVVHGLVQQVPTERVDGVKAMHVAELSSAAEVSAAVRSALPDGVVHLAGISFVASDAELMYRVNLLGTRNLLEALVAAPSPPRAVILASSANVYGNTAAGQLDESMWPAPANDYAVSKLAMEHVAALYAERLPITICRPFNYTGVGQSEAFLLPKIVAHVRRGATRIELGNVDVARDFSDVREVAAIYAQLLETPAAIGATLNICSGQAFTLREILQLVEEISGRHLEIRVNPEFVRRNEVKILLGDRTRLDAILPGPSRRITLRDTLRWMIEH